MHHLVGFRDLKDKLLIHILTIISVEWRDVERVRHTANYGKGFWGYQRCIEN